MEDVNDPSTFLPGTRRLIDAPSSSSPPSSSSSNHPTLQKHGDIVLVPTPTTSPNDPLNWSLTRKTLHSSLVLFVVGLTAATSNDAGSAAEAIKDRYGISYSVFNTGAGVLFIGIAWWCLLSSPAVHLYGRRCLYLVSMVWGFVGSVWYARAQTVNDVVWSQLFVGASESVAEAVVQLSLLDIWFEHQNGTTLGLYTLATAVGTYLGPLIAQRVGGGLGFRWIGWMGAVVCGATFLVLWFGLEETSFAGRGRGPVVDEDVVVAAAAAAEGDAEKNGKEGGNGNGAEAAAEAVAATEAALGRRRTFADDIPKTYLQRIRPITPAPNLRGIGATQFVNRLWHTMRVFTFPAVWFAGLQWGMQNIALTFYLSVMEDTWYGPPWNYNDAEVGNMNIPCIIGSVIGCFYGGWCSDWFVVFMARRRGGIVEAEYRLWLMGLCAAVFPTGMWLFGIGSARGWDWPVPYVGLGFIGFGYGVAGDLSITYLADSYPDMVLEGMVGVAFINNSLALLFAFVTSYWLASGIENCFIELGVISFVVIGLSWPMIVWGKSFRRWTRDRYFKFLEIRDSDDK